LFGFGCGWKAHRRINCKKKKDTSQTQSHAKSMLAPRRFSDRVFLSSSFKDKTIRSGKRRDMAWKSFGFEKRSDERWLAPEIFA